jgi:hypothetical protein
LRCARCSSALTPRALTLRRRTHGHFPGCPTPQFSGRRQAPKAAVDAPLELLDPDMRPRVPPGLVTSIHHRRRRRMLHASQARLGRTGGEQTLRSAAESVAVGSHCAPACAASVFMAGCENAPHPAMNERIGRLARLKGALRRAAPALDPRQPAVGALHLPRVRQLCAPGLPAGASKSVRPPFPAGLVESIYHPKGVAADTSRKGGLR